jgi:alpha-tubulin suppressor-like RCC1 family protein
MNCSKSPRRPFSTFATPARWALLSIGWLVGCDDGTGPSDDGPDPSLQVSVEVLADSFVVEEGRTMVVEVVVRNGHGEVVDPVDVTWASSDTSVATASGGGFISARRAGSAIVTAHVGSVRGDAELTVTPTTYVGPRFYLLSAGGTHACALTDEGEAYCWGMATYGALGGGSSFSDGRATPVAGGLRFTSLSAGHYATCAVSVAGTLYCWGPDLCCPPWEDSAKFVPVPVAGHLRFTLVTVADDFACALEVTGRVFCWGTDAGGVLGSAGELCLTTGRSNLQFFCHRSPTPITDDREFVSIDARSAHTCGLDAAGAAYCWGLVPAVGGSTRSPVLVASSFRFKSVTAGNSHICGITQTNEAFCWGGPAVLRGSNPTLVSGMEPDRLETIAAGSETCGVSIGSVGYCWGDNNFGQLGAGKPSSFKVEPVRVRGVAFRAIASSPAQYNCGISTAGQLFCWGKGRYDRFPGALGQDNGDVECPLPGLSIIARCSAVPVPIAVAPAT